MSTEQANHSIHEPTLVTPESLQEVLSAHGVNPEADSRLHYRRARPRATVGIGELILIGLGPTQALGVVLSGSTSPRLIGVAAALGLLTALATVALIRRSEGVSAVLETVLALVGCAAAAAAYGLTPELAVAGLRLPALVAGAIAVVAAGFVAASMVASSERQAAWARAAAPMIAVAGTFAVL